jgi:hypothetical protein
MTNLLHKKIKIILLRAELVKTEKVEKIREFDLSSYLILENNVR